MRRLVDAFWRAAAYCLHPRVIVLSLAPLAIAAGAAALAGYFWWEDAVASVRQALEGWSLIAAFLLWLDSLGMEGFRTVIGPLVVVALSIPVIVVVSLLLVSLLMTPALAELVAKRRFPTLERRRGGSFWHGVAVSAGCTLAAVVALAASIPFWLVPLMVLVLPPLIWGWLAYRVFAFDVLAEHADRDERVALMREHRWPLLAIGVATGYLGGAPSLIWAFGAMTLVLAPILVVVSVWLYTLVFAFSSLWFAHYALAALAARRAADAPFVPDARPLPPALPPL